MRLPIILLTAAFSGCAILPPSRHSVEGTYTASNYSGTKVTLTLTRDGTYERWIDFTYGSPFVIELEKGNSKEISGWTNYESGIWQFNDRIVLLSAEDRRMENPASEKADFDYVRKIPVTYKFAQGWSLIYPDGIWALMNKGPNNSTEAKAGKHPPSNQSQAPAVPHL
jgi:hypothetical protein